MIHLVNHTNVLQKLVIVLILVVLFVISCSHSNSKKGNQEVVITDQDTSKTERKEVQRYGMVIGLKKDKIDEYKQLHANAWPGVLEQLSESNIRNYSIYLHQIEDKYYLFSYFEYVGDNYREDMKKMAADSVTQEWWKLTDSYQIPLDSRRQGEWWATMEEVFHYK